MSHQSSQPRINLGLCCLNTTLRGKGNKGVFCSRTMIQKNFSVEKAKQYALLNIADIIKLAKWNYDHNIFSLRISSDIFPHFTNPEVEAYDMSFAADALKKAGDAMRQYHQRATFHPGQYNQVGAETSSVFEKTVKDLKMHADMLDMMEIDQDGILCVHGGGVYGDKQKTIQRWIENYKRLPENVQKRLCIENCEYCYSVLDCLQIAEACNIPLIFDSHHFECFNLLSKKEKKGKKGDEKEEEIRVEDVLDRVVETWRKRGITPLFHISEQRPDARIGTHSDLIEKIPKYMLTFVETYQLSLTIEVEAKLKEQAILHLYEKYPHLNREI